jgi:hypothetical protein
MKKERDECGRSREEAIVGQESILKLILTNDVFRESDMEFILRPNDLYVLGNNWSKVLDGPRAEDRVLIRCSLVGVIPRGENEAGFSLSHSSSNEVSVLEAGALDVNDALTPDRNREDHPHRRVQLHRREENHKVVLEDKEQEITTQYFDSVSRNQINSKV